MEYNRKGIDPARPTIYIYMVCRRYLIHIFNQITVTRVLLKVGHFYLCTVGHMILHLPSHERLNKFINQSLSFDIRLSRDTMVKIN